MEEKACNVCKTTKPLSNFYKHRKGYKAACKDCENKARRKKRAENKDQVNEKKRKERKEASAHIKNIDYLMKSKKLNPIIVYKIEKEAFFKLPKRFFDRYDTFTCQYSESIFTLALKNKYFKL